MSEKRSRLIVKIIVLLALLLVGLRMFFSPSKVSGKSMLPTLEDGNVIVASLMYKPKVGDIVVVNHPSYSLVKRIVAMGGQTVDIDPVDGKVFVDGKEIDEPYLKEPTRVIGDIEYPVTVPEGKVFVMGDNRSETLDSRYSNIGFIDESYIKGKVFLRVLPLKEFGLVK